MKKVIKLFLYYFLISIITLVYYFGFRKAHAHVPFSGFPEYVVIAPIMPVWIIGSLIFDNYDQENIKYLLIFIVTTSIVISLKYLLKIIYHKFKYRCNK